jgi:hypothetical protein
MIFSIIFSFAANPKIAYIVDAALLIKKGQRWVLMKYRKNGSITPDYWQFFAIIAVVLYYTTLCIICQICTPG